jgi:lipopolysaccharide/colanic/teichoic acid biosynthesis glycosyltransferase
LLRERGTLSEAKKWGKIQTTFIVMLGAREREIWILLLGDILVLYAALWLTLLLRYVSIPSSELWFQHVVPFTLVFLAWVTIFFISGLYDKHTALFKKRLTSIVLHAQFFNLGVAVLFFFVLPWATIAPKRNLLIYVVVSSLLLIGWRIAFGRIRWPRRKYAALLVGDGPEIIELVEEINTNTRYEFEIVQVVDSALLAQTENVEARLLAIADERDISVIIVDTRNQAIAPILPFLFTLAFLNFRFSIIDMTRLYEDIFDRVPLSRLTYEWFLEHMPQSSRKSYDSIKRAIDIVVALVLGVLFCTFIPLIWVAVWLEDRGPLFIRQERLGKNNSVMRVYKVRTMAHNDTGQWLPASQNRVTRVGAFLRMVSIDEMPQLLNILRGEMSLIGPRNDIGGIAQLLVESIPYYNIRYMIRPGITGWAQTHQMYAPGNISPQSLEEAKVRLAYDLYYIKRRSLLLDITIGLRTMTTVIGRIGALFKKHN